MKNLIVTWRLSRFHYKYLIASLGTGLTPPTRTISNSNPKLLWFSRFTVTQIRKHFISHVHNLYQCLGWLQAFFLQSEGFGWSKTDWGSAHCLQSRTPVSERSCFGWSPKPTQTCPKADSNMPSTLEVTPQNKWEAQGRPYRGLGGIPEESCLLWKKDCFM